MSRLTKAKQKYDVFYCANCAHIDARPFNAGDGLRCPVCGSGLVRYIGTYKKVEPAKKRMSAMV